MIKNKAIFFILIFASTTLWAQNLKIMTFNIRYNTEKDGINKWDNRKDRAAEMLKFYDADICGMQEALIGQINDLQARLPEYAHIGLGRDDGKDKGEFSPIFYNKTKYKLLKTETFWLSETPKVPSKGWDANLPRIVTYGYFRDIEKKTKFYVFNTHYDHIGQIARAESSRLILRKIKEIAGDEIAILTGDFNATPIEEPFKILMNELIETSTISKAPHFGPESTFSGFEAKEQDNRRIDYIFTNNAKVKVKKHATLTNTWAGLFASDHHPVMAWLKIK